MRWTGNSTVRSQHHDRMDVIFESRRLCLSFDIVQSLFREDNVNQSPCSDDDDDDDTEQNRTEDGKSATTFISTTSNFYLVTTQQRPVHA